MDNLDTILFESESVRVGRFRCPVRDPRFNDTGPIKGFLFVFPRTAVRIVHPGRPPIDADPNLVTLYNRGQRYRRERLSDEGDRCEYFAVAPGWALDAVRPYDPAADEAPDRPFRRTHGPSDARTYLAQRLLVTRLGSEQPPDALAVEEAVAGLLARVIEGIYGAGRAPRCGRAGTARAHADLVERARRTLALRYREPMSLAALGREVGASPFHLCRVFHRRAGMTLTGYRSQLRLRAALAAVAETGEDLGSIGVDLGYSSASHFAHAFHAAFSLTPSAIRRQATARRIAALSNLLTA